MSLSEPLRRRQGGFPSAAPDELKRIEDGLGRVQKWLHLEAAAFERWRAPWRGER